MHLRQQVLTGGAFMVMRQGLGLALNLAGIGLLTRIIGPTDYGLYVTAFAIVGFLTMLSNFGIGAYLIRSERTLPMEAYQQALCLLLAIGILLLIPAFIFTPVLVNWLGNDELLYPLRALLPALALTLAAMPAGAMIERKLDYKSIALLELSGQVIYFIMAISLALFNYGVFALVLAYWAQQVLQVVVSHLLTRIPLRLVYSPPLIKEMVGYGFGFSVSQLIWNARSLAIPLLIGRFVGLEGVAFANLATRLVEAMTLSKRIFWRLSLAALAKIQGDRDKLQRALNEAMALQVLSTGPFLAAAALGAPLVLPHVIGPEWNSALRLYPFVALGAMVNGVFLMQSSVLNVTRQNWWVARFHVVHVALLSAGIVFLVPELGVIGYGWAEVAATASYIVLHRRIIRTYNISYRSTVPWVIAFAIPLFAIFVPGPWKLLLLVPSVIIAALPPQLAQIREYLGYFIALVRKNGSRDTPNGAAQPLLEG